jgi:hypothetical protein
VAGAPARLPSAASHIPQIGEEMRIVHDPDNPQRAENLDLLDTWWYGYSDLLVPLVWLGGMLVVAVFANAATGG